MHGFCNNRVILKSGLLSQFATEHVLKLALLLVKHLHTIFTEVAVQRFTVKKLSLKILQNSQENTCARASFLIKLHDSNYIVPN